MTAMTLAERAGDGNYVGMKLDIQGEKVWVDKRKISEAMNDLQVRLNQTAAKIDEGFAVVTPENMRPVRLGSINSFLKWAATFKTGVAIPTSLEKLVPVGAPEVITTALKAIGDTELYLYYAGFAYVKKDPAADGHDVYVRFMIGLRPPVAHNNLGPVALDEIIIACSNFPAIEPEA